MYLYTWKYAGKSTAYPELYDLTEAEAVKMMEDTDLLLRRFIRIFHHLPLLLL